MKDFISDFLVATTTSIQITNDIINQYIILNSPFNV